MYNYNVYWVCMRWSLDELFCQSVILVFECAWWCYSLAQWRFSWGLILIPRMRKKMMSQKVATATCLSTSHRKRFSAKFTRSVSWPLTLLTRRCGSELVFIQVERKVSTFWIFIYCLILFHPVPGIILGKMPSSIDIVFQEMSEWKSKGNLSVSAPKNSVDVMCCNWPCCLYLQLQY